ncbi:MAG: hypothetical protein ACI4QA_07740 [Candidatus Spyradosoma sp.]
MKTCESLFRDFWTTIFCAVAFFVAAASARAETADFASARELAKTSGKDLVVLCVGSGWLPETERLRAEFEKAAENAADADVVFAVYDDAAGLSGEERKKLGALPVAVWAYPAIVYADSAGLPIERREQVSAKTVAGTRKLVEAFGKRRAERDAFWKKAEAAGGRERAEFIGKGLDAVFAHFSGTKFRDFTGKYRAKIDELKRADADDASGYHFKYTFWYLPFMEKVILKNCGEKNFAANYAYADEKLKIPVLTTEQRQQLIIGKYRTAMAEGRLDAATAFLDEAAALDPKSALGRGCARQKAYYTKPVRLDSLEWRERDTRPYWARTSVDVSGKIRGAGTYSVEFRHRRGRTLFRDVRVVSGGKTLGEANGEKRAFEIRVGNAPGRGKVFLEFEMRGTGWFDGCGEIVIEKK